MSDPSADPAAAPVNPLDDVRGPTRRRVLITGGVIVAAAAATAACGSGGSGSPVVGPGGIIPTSEVPEGGGLILTDQKVVLTQPTPGAFKAFTAVCTHKSCLVTSIADGEIVCPCHTSTYSIADGSVTGGPAPAPLAPVPITVSGSTITLG